MLSFDDAQTRVVAEVSPLAAERIFIGEADGRVLRRDVSAPFSLPRFDYSAMDGYALRLADLEAAVTLPVVGESAAGSEPQPLRPNSAMRIFTGAPLPHGADTVVMQERTTRDGDRLAITEPPLLGQNIRRAGEDLLSGCVAVPSGTRLGPGQIALIAALDQANVLVTRRPVVRILCSGDELKNPGEPGAPGTLSESNGLFVAMLARRLGARAELAPFARDDRTQTRDAVLQALVGADLLITIGGVSVGDHDLVRPSLEDAGVTLDFYKVAIKPGKPLVLGRKNEQRVLGLPGNPASAALTFLLFGVPLLRAMLGEANEGWPTRKMVVRGRAKSMLGRTDFLRASFNANEATVADNQASGAVTSFAQASALVVVGPEREILADGDLCTVLDLSSLLR